MYLFSASMLGPVCVVWRPAESMSLGEHQAWHTSGSAEDSKIHVFGLNLQKYTHQVCWLLQSHVHRAIHILRGAAIDPTSLELPSHWKGFQNLAIWCVYSAHFHWDLPLFKVLLRTPPQRQIFILSKSIWVFGNISDHFSSRDGMKTLRCP